ncbi:MAG: LemA family protein [Clostridia bacterium]|nr:LemA family protein [Clostridia bacterium]
MNLLLSKAATGGIIGGVVGAVVLIIIIWAIATHNKFIRKKAQVEDAFANIDVYLKKRFDLIPNLVETVKGYAKHESETFTRVTEARASAMRATTVAEKVVANNELSRAIVRFNKVTENYPELKANANFMDLQAQLRTVENELVNSRKYYNATVREYNSAISTIPNCIIARMMKLAPLPYFEATEEERQNVKVQF